MHEDAEARVKSLSCSRFAKRKSRALPQTPSDLQPEGVHAIRTRTSSISVPLGVLGHILSLTHLHQGSCRNT